MDLDIVAWQMLRAHATCTFTRWEHFCVWMWNEVMAAIL